MEYLSPMARQLNGPIIDSLLRTRHGVFNDAEEFILHRQHLSLDNATEEELTMIGKFLGIPRPYAEVEGEIIYCDVPFYRLFLKNVMLLKTTKSIADFQQMISQFIPNGLFFLEIKENGDIDLTIDQAYAEYEPFFNIAANLVYDALPRINSIADWDFSKFIHEHILYVRLLRILDGSWFLSVEPHIGYISYPTEKGYVEDHVFHMTVVRGD